MSVFHFERACRNCRWHGTPRRFFLGWCGACWRAALKGAVVAAVAIWWLR
jgi:hypothetical protein